MPDVDNFASSGKMLTFIPFESSKVLTIKNSSRAILRMKTFQSTP